MAISFQNCSFKKLYNYITRKRIWESLVVLRNVLLDREKRKGFTGFKQKKDDIVNSNVNAVNTQENDKNFLIKNINNSNDGEMVDTSISEVDLSSVSERKVETIDHSKRSFDEKSITGNRILDMELFFCQFKMASA